MIHAGSSSGSIITSRFIAASTPAHHKSKALSIQIRPLSHAIPLTAAVFVIDSCAERAVVSVILDVSSIVYSSELTFVDLGEILKQTIKGPATMTCKSGAGCVFEEPGMNDLIDSVFGDDFISLNCQSGECLHISQVPGYEVRFEFS